MLRKLLMGWNEPPGGNKGKDPWGNRGNGDGPPDLDEIVKKMQRGFGGLFGGGPRNVGRGSGGNPLIWLAVIIVLLIILIADITYFIDQQERGVVMRFGHYVKTMQPGLNIAYPSFIDRVERVNVGQIRSITHKASMLTQDENIVDVEVAVQWQIHDPAAFKFNVVSPEATLRQVAESAVRSVIGKSKLDFVLTEGRSEIGQRQQELMQKILNEYQAGITIRTVEMQPAKPPEAVKAAFDDAIKAREDEQRQVNEAEAYRNEILPKARGQAARLREEASGYKARVIARAEGETARFEQLLAEYERAPAITRERLYLEAMESVMANTGKVLIDSKDSNSLMYLPLDRILQNQKTKQESPTTSTYDSDRSGGHSSQDMRSQFDNRSRGAR